MVRFWAFRTSLAVTLAMAVCSTALAAQVTPADTAAVLVNFAKQIEAEQRFELVEELLRLVVERYPGTPAAQQAASQLAALRARQQARGGVVPLTVWSTLYGAWLGVAVPAALGADDAEPYGLGLLIGGPLGFFGSRAYGRGASLSSGQARAIILGSQWGTFQGLGWREVLGIGDEVVVLCNGTCFEYSNTPDEAPFTAMVVGGLVGLGTGVALARAFDVPEAQATLGNHAAWWGTWYGFAGAVVADEEEDDTRLAWALIGGNVGLLAGLVAGHRLPVSGGRIRLISAAGVAGLVAGLGVDLLLDLQEEQGVVAIPMLSSIGGLVVGAMLTRSYVAAPERGREEAMAGALLRLGGGSAVGLPLPVPSAIPTMDRLGRTTITPGLRVSLLEARF